MGIKTVRDIEVAGRRILVRVDLNVPLEDSRVTDDTRIQAVLPTIRYLAERGGRVVLCSHLGRPQGGVKETLRLRPVAERLRSLLGGNVGYVPQCVGPQAAEAVGQLPPGGVLLLENVRFHPEEEKNDAEFARALASLAEVFVNDAFGAAHRAHASTVGVTRYLPSVAGLLLERELEMLGKVLHNPRRPLVAIMGGAKLSDKMAVLGNLLDRVDLLLIGGGMAATFFLAQGLRVGRSLVEPDRVQYVAGVMEHARQRGVPLLLPTDVVAAEEFGRDARHQTVDVAAIPDGWYIMDIGPRTIAAFKEALADSGTVVWNGPMGVYEWPAFERGTRELAQTLAGLKNAETIVGGGSTAEVVQALGLAGRMTHVSTGGGASLEFLEGRALPGVAALKQHVAQE
ncbi:MAG: phosphoglycerate kinase [Chloroflexi bacterium]|nr:phosphoglycerate kinase [Chloroflexota bacterium]